MPNILAIDTSNACCSAALVSSGRLVSRHTAQLRQHARLLLPMVQELLDEQQLGMNALHAIAFVSGPGSFTGLRIGAGVAQGLAFAVGLPVLPVSSLAVMAAKALQGSESQRVFVSLQAREDELYGALYEREQGDVRLVATERVGGPELFLRQLQSLGNDVCIAGDLTLLRQNESTARAIQHLSLWEGDCSSDATALCRLAQLRFERGEGVEPMLAQPVYVKEQMDYRE